MNASIARWMKAAAGAVALAAALGAPAFAQRATEQFIPIGRSPGVSGVTAEIGVVTRVDERAGVMAIEVDGVEHRYAMTPRTEVWLDRSQARRTNVAVGYAGLRVGDVVEVNRLTPRVSEAVATARATGLPIADWIKISDEARD